jgi:hypothetical protein
VALLSVFDIPHLQIIDVTDPKTIQSAAQQVCEL